MSITAAEKPWRIVIQWDDTGSVGASFQTVNRVYLDNKLVTEAAGRLAPLSLAGEAGIPLAEVMPLVVADALATIDRLQGDFVSVCADRDGMKADLDVITSERDALRAELEAAKAEPWWGGEQQ